MSDDSQQPKQLGTMQSGPSQVSPKREKLEVETAEERQERLGRLFTSQPFPGPSTPISLPPIRPDIGHVPQSDVLSRVRNFLPLFKSSNDDVLSRARANPEEVDIENTKGDERVIMMDLGLGVFDVQGRTSADMGPEVEIPEGAESLGSDEEDEDDEEDGEEQDEDDDDSSDSSGSSTDDEESQSPIRQHP